MPTILRAALWICLGGWIGAMLLFAFGIAPVVFGVLPASEAGQIVGPVLHWIHLYGVGAGLLLALLAVRLGRSRTLVALPIVLAVICAASEFGVTGAIAAVRPSSFGPDTQADAGIRFRQLHQLSMVLYGIVCAGAILLVGLHAHSDARADRGEKP